MNLRRPYCSIPSSTVCRLGTYAHRHGSTRRLRYWAPQIRCCSSVSGGSRVGSVIPGRVRFDQLWQQSTGTDLPEWAFIDQQKIDWAMRWISAPDFTIAETFLRQNDHLLGGDYDGAVDEAILVLDTPRAAALMDIRARLRFAASTSHANSLDLGLEAAASDADRMGNGQPNAYDLAEHFLASNFNQRLVLLAEHGEELRGDTVGRHLRARRDSPRASAAVSLIELSRVPLYTAVAAAAANADQTESVLARIAESHDTKTLRQAAVVLMNQADDAADLEVTVVGSFYLGVSLLDSEFAAQGQELIAAAAEAAPRRVSEWRRLCGRLSAAKPVFGQAAGILDEQPDGEGG
jgi:hypothetical protein